ncbi:hypothetical protein IID22_00660 [Patescibacteria group bacterium]|nr:hypothetical protein [Patescibacteria group bacterium]
MVDRGVEKKIVEKKEFFIPGVDEPVEREGYVARSVRGRDPTKSPNEVSGWRMVPLSGNESDEPPFVLPPELRSDGVHATQKDFMDKVDEASKNNKKS